jgi:hypothetical protein
VTTSTANYTTINELLSTPLSQSPATARSINPDYKPQRTYNYSIGVQRDLGWKLLGDIAYVGSKGRRLLQTRNINAVPYGTDFLPSSIDPTVFDEGFLRQLERLQLIMKAPVRGGLKGGRRSVKRGQSVEFADFRDYALGDDLRQLDWNVLARLEKLFIKLYVEE